MRTPADWQRTAHDESDRGRTADHPGQIPAKGWWDILLRVKNQLTADNVSLVAAGLGLFALLSVFPTLTAAVAIYGFFASPDAIAAQLQSFGNVLPQEGLQILERQLTELASHRSALGAGAVIGILLALWSARSGTVALMTAMNVAYSEREHRSFLRRVGVSLALVCVGVVGFLALVTLGIAVPVALKFLPLGDAAEWLLQIVRWALLWFLVVMALAFVYRFAPDRKHAKWRWVSWGSGIATTLWILASIGFAIYVRNFSSYSKAYGALAGVIVTLMWFYISSYVVVLGAEVDSEMERQTVKDTTIGEQKPLGERGAHAADTVGPSAGHQ